MKRARTNPFRQEVEALRRRVEALRDDAGVSVRCMEVEAGWGTTMLHRWLEGSRPTPRVEKLADLYDAVARLELAA